MRAAVFIGRFQPLHNGHKTILLRALEDNDAVIVVIGSINRHDDRNPFSFETRKQFMHAIDPRLIILGIEDYCDLVRWCEEVNRLLFLYSRTYDLYLYGAMKDDSTSAYIKAILERTVVKRFVEIGVLMNDSVPLNATDIRKAIKDGEDFDHLVPAEVVEILK